MSLLGLLNKSQKERVKLFLVKIYNNNGNLKKSFVLLLCTGLMLVGCESEIEQRRSLLVGKWQLESAERNHEPTSTLQNTYLTFDKNGNMSTNLLGTENEKGTFKLEDEFLLTQLSTPIQFTIDSLIKNKLTISTNLRGHHLILRLEK